MDVSCYPFGVGTFRCASLRDGAFNYPLQSMFANVPQPEVEAALRARGLPADRVETPYTCLFVDTGVHKVLVDTGAGGLGAMGAKVFPGIDHTTTVTGQIVESLSALGVQPEQIDTVLISHAHPDHIGGTLDAAGRPVFANARYLIGREEWEFWNDPDAATRTNPLFVQIARHALEPVRERLVTVEPGDTVLPGVRAIGTPGHTPGHLAFAFESGGATLIHGSDVVLHSLLLERTAWRNGFDMDAEAASRSLRLLMELALEREALLFMHHVAPFPNLGRVSRAPGGWIWEPVR